MCRVCEDCRDRGIYVSAHAVHYSCYGACIHLFKNIHFLNQKMSLIPHFTIIFVNTTPTVSCQPIKTGQCVEFVQHIALISINYVTVLLYGTTECLAHSKPFAGILLSVTVVRLSECDLLFRHFLMFVSLLTNWKSVEIVWNFAIGSGERECTPGKPDRFLTCEHLI